MTAYTNYYKKMKDSELEQWPPKFWKFQLTTTGKNPVEVAFTDARRFGRVRLVDCPGADIRKHSPLVENGPDPVVDTDRFTYEYLRGKMQSRRVPVKALLLDQTVISGIGNWVADETLYNAKMHPEQYSDTFTEGEVKTLYDNIVYVCKTAVDLLGDSDQFPKHWLFNHRWGKGDKGAPSALPNGDKLAFITVGGRTSCYAPGVQRKTGQVVPDAKAVLVKTEEEIEQVPKKKKAAKKKAEQLANGDAEQTPPVKKRKTSAVKSEDKVKIEVVDTSAGRRRSARLGK